jgi:hypothetical protein
MRSVRFVFVSFRSGNQAAHQASLLFKTVSQGVVEMMERNHSNILKTVRAFEKEMQELRKSPSFPARFGKGTNQVSISIHQSSPSNRNSQLISRKSTRLLPDSKLPPTRSPR